jgi:hypothetical protein
MGGDFFGENYERRPDISVHLKALLRNLPEDAEESHKIGQNSPTHVPRKRIVFGIAWELQYALVHDAYDSRGFSALYSSHTYSHHSLSSTTLKQSSIGL